MTTPEPTTRDDIAAALRRCETARTSLDQATEEHRAAMLAALEVGAPKARIARSAGVSPQTVYGLLGWKRSRP
ncbi:helix-turn-helix domain-containing protein [Actinomyces howellii]|uniref:Uncharacterized protein n=1 Tax=Actinomyces howellii TaxID=52771 RepID=A0A448HGR6_9ACTO|nr:helix-turn-helix domain-containing protein [Actinomyces howellii]VEG28075.1 Uncharacterised protein [Actinomyces howellii]